MLRERATKAIAILHSAGDVTHHRCSDPVLEIDSADTRQVRQLLTSSGLLDDAGHLLRPLSSISLYEILAIVDEGIYPVHSDDDELPRPAAVPVRKQGMYRTMIRELLLHMKVSEL